ncbi:MAG: diacylglycerol/polyprenol kinase family protein [Cyanobacteria bacterium J06632_22]
MTFSTFSDLDSLTTDWPLLDWSLSVGLVVLWLGLVGSASEIARRQGYGAELTRKIVHIGAGQVILLAWWRQIPAWMGITAAVAAAIVALVSYRLPILPGVNSVGRRSLGTFFYAISMGSIVAWFWPQQPYYGVIGILIMSWGDGLAALVGQRWGQHPYQVLGQQKSWEGSATMLGVSFAIALLILLSVQGATWQTWAVAAATAVTATALETLSQFGIDNLTVPLGAAAVALYLNTLW